VELEKVLAYYQSSFANKSFLEPDKYADVLMEAFGITPEAVQENRQYWGRELGMCWQELVISACRNLTDYAEGLKVGEDRPCDLRVGKDAIDTKYRIGSGDSGTLKKFRANAKYLAKEGYRPVLLLLREDSLAGSVKTCKKSGWDIYTGEESLNYVKALTGVDLKDFLLMSRRRYCF